MNNDKVSLKRKTIKFPVGNSVVEKYIDEIYAIEIMIKSPDWLRVHRKFGLMQMSISIDRIEKQLDNTFFQCHKCYIVNLKHIKELDLKRCMAIMDNGKEIPVSFWRRHRFLKCYRSSLGAF